LKKQIWMMMILWWWVQIPLRRDVLDTTLCDKVCLLLATARWFSPGTPVSVTNKTDCHDITEILLKVTLNTITHPLTLLSVSKFQSISIYFKHKLILRKFSLEVFHYHACWVVDAYSITFSNCTATLWLQHIEESYVVYIGCCLYSGFPLSKFEQVNWFQSYSPCRSNPAHGNLRCTWEHIIVW
jgi:hypothetical protein